MIETGVERCFILAVLILIELDPGGPTLPVRRILHCDEHVEHRFIQAVLNGDRLVELGRAGLADVRVVGEVKNGHDAVRIRDLPRRAKTARFGKHRHFAFVL